MVLNYKFKAYFCPGQWCNIKKEHMNPSVSIIMGSTSDLKVMEKAAEFLDSIGIPFEINALSAHRTPDEVEKFARGAAGRGIKVIIAGAGMAAHLPGCHSRHDTCACHRGACQSFT